MSAVDFAEYPAIVAKADRANDEMPASAVPVIEAASFVDAVTASTASVPKPAEAFARATPDCVANDRTEPTPFAANPPSCPVQFLNEFATNSVDRAVA